MDSREIRYWFEVHSKCRLEHGKSEDDLEWYLTDVDIVRFCDQIAAQHEAEVAEMADCLKWLDDHHAASHGAWRNDAEKYSERRNNQVLDTVQQILQSAPKVRWSGAMRARLANADGDTPETMWLEPEDGGDGPIIEMYGIPECVDDAEQVTVIVLSCPEKEE